MGADADSSSTHALCTAHSPLISTHRIVVGGDDDGLHTGVGERSLQLSMLGHHLFKRCSLNQGCVKQPAY